MPRQRITVNILCRKRLVPVGPQENTRVIEDAVSGNYFMVLRAPVFEHLDRFFHARVDAI